ncbi:aldo/keto reductase [Planctomycetales bacterium ZRK34]|nr:aldo/keto reductase [Planctomycetales bacterium ZRK34]
MKYINIQSRSVPALGFGTWQLRGDTCIDSVADAIEIGYRHIDTAQMYENEEAVGKAIAMSGVPRDELFVTTKLGLGELTPDSVRRTTCQSLDRLRLKYVDLLLIHWPDESVPLDETIGAMNALRDEGMIRHVGVSNFTPTLVDEAAQHAQLFCNQVEYHPLLSQARMREKARSMGFMLTAYSPLARGNAFDKPVIKELAKAHNKHPAQIVLRWLIQQEHVAAIPRASSSHHRRSNFDIFNFELDDDQMRRISELGGDQRLIDPEWAPAWER